MTPKIKRIVVAVITFLVLTNLATLALLWKDHREKYPGKSKPQAGLKITVERIPNSAATPAFAFATIPQPSNTNAATFANIRLVTGFPTGESLHRLLSPNLPGGPDAPTETFHFTDGTYGGRFMIDLNQSIAIRQVNTYSWHVGSRAPQVYKLYALDSSSEPEPVGTQDPFKLGWKFLADVDTRPATGDVGGQYGVSVSSPNGAIGHYRYLLFDCKRTEEVDRWGNTFYCKIDVIGE